MGALNLLARRLRDAGPAREGTDPPIPRLRPIPMPEKMPGDDLGRDIAFLLAEHPGLASVYGNIDLDAMTEAAKVQMLGDLKDALGIRPVKTRKLGYVGD